MTFFNSQTTWDLFFKWLNNSRGLINAANRSLPQLSPSISQPTRHNQLRVIFRKWSLCFDGWCLSNSCWRRCVIWYSLCWWTAAFVHFVRVQHVLLNWMSSGSTSHVYKDRISLSPEKVQSIEGKVDSEMSWKLSLNRTEWKGWAGKSSDVIYEHKVFTLVELSFKLCTEKREAERIK